MGGQAGGVRFVDLDFQHVPMVIAAAILEGPGGVVVVDPGPASCLPTLEAGLARTGLGVHDISAVLLTHIHLDHAGATGTLVRDNPGIRVFVHERGAPHAIDPTRLLASASRLYGDQMQALWGETIPVPAGNVQTLAGGETVEVAGRSFEVAYTPGHAWHHVSYFDPSSGLAFVGDTCGGRIGHARFVMPPTPPPDVDLEAWNLSLDRILAWQPGGLFLTHFGPSEHPQAHVDELRQRLSWAAAVVKDALQQHPDPAEDSAASAIFEREARRELRRHVTEAEARSYELAIVLDHCYQGLARYWRKRGV